MNEIHDDYEGDVLGTPDYLHDMSHPYAQAVLRLEEQHPGLQITCIGGACPFQMEGTTPEGLRFYMRYRHDDAQLYVYRGKDHVDGLQLYAEIDNAMEAGWDRGYLDADEAVDLFGRLWALLKPRDQWESTGSERLAAAVRAYSDALALQDYWNAHFGEQLAGQEASKESIKQARREFYQTVTPEFMETIRTWSRERQKAPQE